MGEKKDYYAFISYKREDEHWAKWLQNKLEHYRLPSNLNGRTDLPREIRPIFRDSSELTPGNLPRQIQDALNNSHHLIVICSPRSAKSKWVNSEIETFIASGKQERVIPFIIDGKPFDEDPDAECFPPAIRNLPKDQELLGANITEMGRDAAAVKVVAKMFGLRFDTLWKRYEREQKRKKALITTAVLVFMLAVLGVSAYIFHQNAIITKSQANLLQAYNNLSLANQETEKERLRAEAERDRANQEKEHAENERDRANQEKNRANQEKNRANLERDRANQEKHRAELAEDSIRIQYSIIEQTYNDLRQATYAKSQAQSRASAEIAMKIHEDGDSYLASKIATEALDIAYTVEAEAALRQACQHNSTILKGLDKWESATAACFSPDGKLIVSAGSNGELFVWEVSTGKCLNILSGHNSWINNVCFSPDSKLIASASHDETVRIWDAATGKCLIHDNSYDEDAIAGFTTDGRYIVSTPDMGHYIISDVSNPKDYTKPGTGIGKYEPSSFTVISNDGKKLLSVQENKLINVIDIETDDITALKIAKTNSFIQKALFSPDNKLILTISGSIDVHIWDIASKRCIQSFNGTITESASFSPDGKNIATAPGPGNIISIWDIATGEKLKTIPISLSQYEEIRDIQYSPDGKHLTAAVSDGTVRLLEIDQDASINTFDFDYTVSVAYSPDRKYMILGLEDGKVHIRDSSTGKLIKTFEDASINFAQFGKASFSPDGSMVLWCTDGFILVWDFATGKLLHTFYDKWSFDFSPDSRLLAIGGRDSVKIWDTRTWNCIKVFDESDIFDVSFSPDGNHIISSTGHGDNIWDIQSDKLIHNVLKGRATYGHFERFSPDGKYIMFFSSDSIGIWDTSEKKPIHYLECNMTEDPIDAIFSPDGKRIIITDPTEDILLVWDISSGKIIQKLNGHTRYIHSISQGPNERQFVTTSSDGTTKIWDIPPIETLIQETRKRFENNPLTHEDRIRFYLE